MNSSKKTLIHITNSIILRAQTNCITTQNVIYDLATEREFTENERMMLDKLSKVKNMLEEINKDFENEYLND